MHSVWDKVLDSDRALSSYMVEVFNSIRMLICLMAEILKQYVVLMDMEETPSTTEEFDNLKMDLFHVCRCVKLCMDPNLEFHSVTGNESLPEHLALQFASSCRVDMRDVRIRLLNYERQQPKPSHPHQQQIQRSDFDFLQYLVNMFYDRKLGPIFANLVTVRRSVAGPLAASAYSCAGSDQASDVNRMAVLLHAHGLLLVLHSTVLATLCGMMAATFARGLIVTGAEGLLTLRARRTVSQPD